MVELLRSDRRFLDRESWDTLASMGIIDVALYERPGVGWRAVMVFSWPSKLWALRLRPTRPAAVDAMREFLGGLLMVRSVVEEQYPPIDEGEGREPVLDVIVDWHVAAT